MWEPSMCCCFRLRTGSIILGFLFLIGGCLNIILGIRSLHKEDIINKHACENHLQKLDTKDCVSPFWYLEYITIGMMVVSCFQILFGGLLLYGIFKQKPGFFVPVMIQSTVVNVLLILATVIAIAVLLLRNLQFEFILLLAVAMGSIIFLNVYCLLVTRAHYYEIKRAMGHTHTTLKEQNAEAPAYLGLHATPPHPATKAPGYPGGDAF